MKEMPDFMVIAEIFEIHISTPDLEEFTLLRQNDFNAMMSTCRLKRVKDFVETKLKYQYPFASIIHFRAVILTL